MRQWYYATLAGQQAQTDEANLPGLVKSGQITPETLVWRDGLPQWTPAATALPALFVASSSVASPSPSDSTISAAPVAASTPSSSAPVYTPAPSVAPASASPAAPAPAWTAPAINAGGSSLGVAPDMVVRRIMSPLYQRKGWIKFVAVVMIVSSLPSAFMLIGIPLLIAGVMLFKAASRVEQAHVTGDITAAEETSRNISSFFFIQAVFTLVMFAVALIASVVMAFIVVGGASVGLMQQKKAAESHHWKYEQPTLPANTEEGAPESADELAPVAPGSR